ncbi:MAG: DUF47 family protein [Planctomycetota bacterium]|jgi:uncharacterized protein Yka (UPF0111/DUF47 family)|nr:DUF47 family protein [Planctomycetota bacterium]
MNRLFDKLKPKENRFFLLLKEMTAIIESTANVLMECVKTQNIEQVAELFGAIKEQKHHSAVTRDKIYEELNTSFITPFDREDISHLASTLDDVEDLINKCVKRITIYKPKRIPAAATELARLVGAAAQCLTQAVEELDTFKKHPAVINGYVEKLADIERRSDETYEAFVIDLFENEKDAIELLKLKETLKELERATDAARAVGRIIRTIVVKYS